MSAHMYLNFHAVRTSHVLTRATLQYVLLGTYFFFFFCKPLRVSFSEYIGMYKKKKNVFRFCDYCIQMLCLHAHVTQQWLSASFFTVDSAETFNSNTYAQQHLVFDRLLGSNTAKKKHGRFERSYRSITGFVVEVDIFSLPLVVVRRFGNPIGYAFPDDRFSAKNIPLRPRCRPPPPPPLPRRARYVARPVYSHRKFFCPPPCTRRKRLQDLFLAWSAGRPTNPFFETIINFTHALCCCFFLFVL